MKTTLAWMAVAFLAGMAYGKPAGPCYPTEPGSATTTAR